MPIVWAKPPRLGTGSKVDTAGQGSALRRVATPPGQAARSQRQIRLHLRSNPSSKCDQASCSSEFSSVPRASHHLQGAQGGC